MRLKDKVALVTGGSRGIGRACVRQLANEGAKVTFVYHSNQEAAESLVAEMAQAGIEVSAQQADVRDAKRAQQIVESIVEQHQRIDILVNSAGVVRDGLHVQLLSGGGAAHDVPTQWECGESFQHCG